MRALLLAAGLGTRLRPVTNTIPKCLIPINNRPLLDYWLDLLLGQGIDRVLINTHYLASLVTDHILQSPWSNRIDTVFEEELLGTAGTIKKNSAYFGESSFLVAHADNLVRFDLEKFINKHKQRPDGVHITMMTFRTDNPQSCGIVEEDSSGIVQAFHEKVETPPGNYANGAIYIFDNEVLSELMKMVNYKLDLSTEVLPLFLGKINTYFNDDYLLDIGSPEALERASRDFNTTI